MPNMNEALNGSEFSFPKSSDTCSYREWIVLSFARRVAQGKAKPYECDFMRTLMQMELPERNILGDCMSAYNLTSICDGVEQGDCSAFERLFDSWQPNFPEGGE